MRQVRHVSKLTNTLNTTHIWFVFQSRQFWFTVFGTGYRRKCFAKLRRQKNSAILPPLYSAMKPAFSHTEKQVRKFLSIILNLFCHVFLWRNASKKVWGTVLYSVQYQLVRAVWPQWNQTTVLNEKWEILKWTEE